MLKILKSRIFLDSLTFRIFCYFVFFSGFFVTVLQIAQWISGILKLKFVTSFMEDPFLKPTESKKKPKRFCLTNPSLRGRSEVAINISKMFRIFPISTQNLKTTKDFSTTKRHLWHFLIKFTNRHQFKDNFHC